MQDYLLTNQRYRCKALVYLGRYLYRGVIQEGDILRSENGQVTYRWRDSKAGKMAQRTVSGVEFDASCCSTSCPRPCCRNGSLRASPMR